MLASILVPLDGSELAEQVLPTVATLAEKLAAPVTLIHIVDTPLLPADVRAEHRAYLERLTEREEEHARHYLQRIRADLARLPAVSAEVVPGSAPASIVSYAHSQGIGLIAMSTHGRSGLGRWLMGSVADSVVHRAPMPVLLFRPRPGSSAVGSSLQRLLLPLDGSPAAERALPFAEALARALGLKLVLVRAVSAVSFAFTEPYPFGGTQMAVALWDAVEQEAGEYLGRVLRALEAKGLDVESCVLHGEAAGQIMDLAGRTPGTLVVMSSHGRSGVGRALFGSVADRVVRGSGAPVLVVRATE